MVCAHEPVADPRISWAARSASVAFEVTVLGVAADRDGHAEFQGAGGYQIVRLQRTSVGITRYLWLMKDVGPRGLSAAVAALIVLGAPFLLLAEAVLSLASKAASHV